MKAMTCVKLIGLSTVLSFSTVAVAADYGTTGSTDMNESGIKQVTPTPKSTVKEHLQSEGRVSENYGTTGSADMNESGIKQITPTPKSTVKEHLQSEGRISDSKPGMSYGFSQLDQNKDGMVSEHEVPAGSPLRQNWNSADRDASGAIDRAEFSAFETSEGIDVEKVTPTPDEGNTVQDHLQTEEK